MWKNSACFCPKLYLPHIPKKNSISCVQQEHFLHSNIFCSVLNIALGDGELIGFISYELLNNAWDHNWSDTSSKIIIKLKYFQQKWKIIQEGAIDFAITRRKKVELAAIILPSQDKDVEHMSNILNVFCEKWTLGIHIGNLMNIYFQGVKLLRRNLKKFYGHYILFSISQLFSYNLPPVFNIPKNETFMFCKGIFVFLCNQNRWRQ